MSQDKNLKKLLTTISLMMKVAGDRDFKKYYKFHDKQLAVNSKQNS